MAGPLTRLLFLTALGLALLAPMPCAVPRPDLVMLLLAPLSVRGGRAAGAWYGFGGGLLLGLLGAGNPGLLAGAYGLAGLVMGLLGEEGGTHGVFMQLLALIIGTVTVGLELAAVGTLAPNLGGPGVSTMREWLPQALLVNLLLAWPARGLFQAVVGERAFKSRGLEL